jgi:hypothetical protein
MLPRHQRLVLYAIYILGTRRLGREEIAQGSPILRSWLFPIFLNRIPALAQALFIGIAILRDDGRDPLRVRQSKSEPYGRAVIEDINRVAFETHRLREAVNNLAQILKRVAKPLTVRRIREAEAQQIGCDHMEAVGQSRNEIAEHVR